MKKILVLLSVTVLLVASVAGTATAAMSPAKSSNMNRLTSPMTPADIVAPAVPVLDATYATSASTLTLAWNAVEGATSYEYQLNNGSITSLSAPTVELSGLVEGSNTLLVRSVNEVGTSDWVSSVITYTVAPNPTVPAAPVFDASYDTTSTSFLLKWAAVEGATGYRVSLNGGEAVATTDSSFTLADLAVGSNTVTVVAFNEVGDSASATTTVNYTVPAPVEKKDTHMSLKCSKFSRHMGETADFSGRLLTDENVGVAGKTVTLYRNVNGAWEMVTTAVTDANGNYQFSSVIKVVSHGSMRYRVLFSGDAEYNASHSNVATVKVAKVAKHVKAAKTVKAVKVAKTVKHVSSTSKTNHGHAFGKTMHNK